MLLEPGPLPPIATSWYNFAVLTPDFSDMAAVFWAQGDQITAQMDALGIEALVSVDPFDGDTMSAELQTLDDQNAQNWAGMQIVALDNNQTAHDYGSHYLKEAVQFMPGEAFRSPQAAQFAADPFLEPTTAQIAKVTLLDTTINSGTNFYTLDQYQIQVHMSTTTGAVSDYLNVAVSAVMTHDNGAPSTIPLGLTDFTGLVTYFGSWGLADYGAWTMVIRAAPRTGGVVEASGYQWTVAPSTHPVHGPLTPAVNVVFQNVTSLDNQNNHVGDVWSLLVTGPPSSPVFVWATHDAAALAQTQLGDTLADGTFTLTGGWTNSDVGQWTEHYSVGNFPWPQALSFTVQPRAPVTTGPGGVLTA